MSSNGGADGHPLRVTLDQQRLADALAHALSGDDVSVHAEESGWIVSIDGAKTDHFVVRVLAAIRDTLARQADSSAVVELDGQEYVMRGEDHVSTSAPPAARSGESAAPGSDDTHESPPQAAERHR